METQPEQTRQHLQEIYDSLPQRAPIMSRMKRYIYCRNNGNLGCKEMSHKALGGMRYQKENPLNYILAPFQRRYVENFYELSEDCIKTGHFVRALRYIAEDCACLNLRAIIPICQKLQLGKRELKVVANYILKEKETLLKNAKVACENDSNWKGGSAGCLIAQSLWNQNIIPNAERDIQGAKSLIETLTELEGGKK